MDGDVLTIEGDTQAGEALLQPAMRGGRRVGSCSLEESRGRAARELSRLPEAFRGLDAGVPYPVEVAPALRALADEVDRRIAAAT